MVLYNYIAFFYIIYTKHLFYINFIFIYIIIQSLKKKIKWISGLAFIFHINKNFKQQKFKIKHVK